MSIEAAGRKSPSEARGGGRGEDHFFTSGRDDLAKAVAAFVAEP